MLLHGYIALRFYIKYNKILWKNLKHKYSNSQEMDDVLNLTMSQNLIEV